MFYSPKTDADPQSTCVFPTEALKNQPAMSPQKVLAEISQSIPHLPKFLLQRSSLYDIVICCWSNSHWIACYIMLYPHFNWILNHHPMITLWWTNIAMENHHFSWENPLLMVIFNSYVKLPEGIWSLLVVQQSPFSIGGVIPEARRLGGPGWPTIKGTFSDGETWWKDIDKL